MRRQTANKERHISDIDITLDETEAKGRYVACVEGYDDVGELTFSKAGASLIIVHHTEVPDALRGKGIGVALAARVAVDARAKGVKIVPLCPFLKHRR